MTTHIGLGHAAVITSVRFSADGRYIISASAAGTIFVWKVPQDETVPETPGKIVDLATKLIPKEEHIKGLKN